MPADSLETTPDSVCFSIDEAREIARRQANLANLVRVQAEQLDTERARVAIHERIAGNWMATAEEHERRADFLAVELKATRRKVIRVAIGAGVVGLGLGALVGAR